MSLKRQSNGEDYPDSAEKHCIDARLLLDNSRADGAAYLAGYTVECILKTLIQVERRNSARVDGHWLDTLSNSALELATLPGSRTHRYLKRYPITAMPYGEPPAAWRETLRYRPQNCIPLAVAKLWLEDAERLYVEVIGEMRKDGEV